MQVNLDDTVTMADGTVLHLEDVIVDPYDLTITHLALTPADSALTRMVPVDEVHEDGGELHRGQGRLHAAPLQRTMGTRQPCPGTGGGMAARPRRRG